MPKKEKKPSNGTSGKWPQRSPGLCPIDYFYYGLDPEMKSNKKAKWVFQIFNEKLSYYPLREYYDAVEKWKVFMAMARP